MGQWKSWVKNLMPSPVRRQLGRIKRQFSFYGDLNPSQVDRLLEHARQIGLDPLLSLIDLIEERHGHRRSARERRSVDQRGQPLPWFTYPAIAYLEQLDLREKNIFEFGSGYSSLFYAKRARRVMSVENNPAWQAEIASLAPANLEVLLREQEEDYVQAIAQAGQTWDVVIVDCEFGSWRRKCAQALLPWLAPTGFVILDNADWFPHTAADLRRADLIEVDFAGLSPINYYTLTTSFFFRRDVQLQPRNPLHPAGTIGSLPTLGE